MEDFTYQPIGYLHCFKKNPYEAAQQASIETSEEVGVIKLKSSHNFEQALQGLDKFSHLWLIFSFHHNQHWKPMVHPPRMEAGQQKVGVFATRAPYRPNNIGISCVELVKIESLNLFIKKFDLLDRTPILDIKPYLAYADSFPNSQLGWLENTQDEYQVHFLQKAQNQIQFLKSNSLSELENFLRQQLRFNPTDPSKKRLKQTAPNRYVLAYRTWRAEFLLENTQVVVQNIFSGYSEEELQSPDDPYLDKNLHRVFTRASLY